MSTTFDSIKKQIEQYQIDLKNVKRHIFLLIIITNMLLIIFLLVFRKFGPIHTIAVPVTGALFTISLIFLIAKISRMGVVCPHCGNKIQMGPYGNTSKIDIVLNMRQCPLCQGKFH